MLPLEELVRLSARLSALLFCAALLLTPRVRAVSALLATFVFVHTVHFGFVVAHAQATGGLGVAERGGWTHALAIAAAFYLTSLHLAARSWRRRTDAPLPWRGTETASVLILAFFFANAYVPRALSSASYVPMAALLVVAVAWFARWRWLARPPAARAAVLR